jgi:hypothetical protein
MRRFIVFIQLLFLFLVSIVFFPKALSNFTTFASCESESTFEPQTDNLFVFGTFEVPFVEDLEGYWSVLGDASKSLYTDLFFSGCKSLLVSNRDHYWNGLAYTATNLVEPGKMYEISGRVRSNSVASATLLVTAKKTDASGTTYSHSSNQTVTSTEWTKLRFYYTHTENAPLTELVFYFEQSSSDPVVASELLFDEIIFRELPSATTFFIDVENGNDGYSGLSPEYAWKTTQPVSLLSFSEGQSILFKKGQRHLLSQPLVVSGAGAESSPITISSYATGAKPILENTVYSQYASTIWVQAENVTISDIEIQNTGNHTIESGIRLAAPHGIVENVEISSVAYGILVEADNQTISNSKIRDLVMLINDEVEDNDKGSIGILVLNASNISVHSSEFLRLKEPSTDYVTDGAAIEFFGSVSTVEFYNNLVQDSEALTEFGSSNITDLIENIIFHHNVIYNNRSEIGFVHNDVSSNYAVMVRGIYFDHNTFYKDTLDVSGFFIGFQRSPLVDEIYLRNNIISVRNRENWVWESSMGSATRIGNIYHTTAVADFGYELHESELQADPLFVSAQTLDLKLLGTSPAIDFGIDLNYQNDFDNNSVPYGLLPDSGAFEFLGDDEENNYSSSQESLNLNAISRYGDASINQSCMFEKPISNAPVIFEIRTTATTAELFWVPVSNTATHYLIEYGIPGYQEARYFDTVNAFDNTGVISHSIAHLSKNTPYYFQISARNGCAAGNWSNVMQAKTGKNHSSAIKKVFYLFME